MTYLITITEPASPESGPRDTSTTTHYIRRVQCDDLNTVIQRLDGALNVKIRAKRKDAGQKRTKEEQP